MKKALLVVHRYQFAQDKEWGFVAKDYATSDMIKNISTLYPDYEWRPATLAQTRQLLREVEIDLLLLVPVLKDHLANWMRIPMLKLII
ncbi:hypothetical protein [Enterococcus raffinosus]|uniref:hypothetical protein n=1 Tax=Enterococcus raffinosus TaxID=71452 RepID=UPI0020A136EC|nr:hypothetical protein [Enterococcus raffinosus]